MPTLSKTMLNNLHIGNASIKLLPYTSGGVTLAGLDFTEADEIFTIRDSFKLAPSDPNTNPIYIDQNNEQIELGFTPGDYIINANIPSVDPDLIAYFFNIGTAIIASSPIKASAEETYTGKGVNEVKTVESSILVQSENKETAIVFARVKLIATPITIDDHQNPAYIKLLGYVLANPSGDDWAILGKTTVSP